MTYQYTFLVYWWLSIVLYTSQFKAEQFWPLFEFCPCYKGTSRCVVYTYTHVIHFMSHPSGPVIHPHHKWEDSHLQEGPPTRPQRGDEHSSSQDHLPRPLAVLGRGQGTRSGGRELAIQTYRGRFRDVAQCFFSCFLYQLPNSSYCFLLLLYFLLWHISPNQNRIDCVTMASILKV